MGHVHDLAKDIVSKGIEGNDVGSDTLDDAECGNDLASSNCCPIPLLL